MDLLQFLMLQKQSFFEFFQDKSAQSESEKIVESVITLDEPFIDYFSQMRITVLEGQIQTAIEDKFHIQCEVCLVCTVDAQTAEFKIEKIVLQTPFQVAEELKKDVIAYLKTYYSVEVKMNE